MQPTKLPKYDLALFFLCVRTNVNYTVVAEFIVQSGEIADALKDHQAIEL